MRIADGLSRLMESTCQLSDREDSEKLPFILENMKQEAEAPVMHNNQSPTPATGVLRREAQGYLITIKLGALRLMTALMARIRSANPDIGIKYAFGLAEDNAPGWAIAYEWFPNWGKVTADTALPSNKNHEVCVKLPGNMTKGTVFGGDAAASSTFAGEHFKSR
ncbi:uncharacterized protein PG998_004537 [Apiospora kogelbergensis]|uniref:uncharacterized protein n=1 Tax=Apiospora kogelbergensis TaxID=1337665 RepID=UPI00312E7A30